MTQCVATPTCNRTLACQPLYTAKSMSRTRRGREITERQREIRRRTMYEQNFTGHMGQVTRQLDDFAQRFLRDLIILPCYLFVRTPLLGAHLEFACSRVTSSASRAVTLGMRSDDIICRRLCSSGRAWRAAQHSSTVDCERSARRCGPARGRIAVPAAKTTNQQGRMTWCRAAHAPR